MMNVKPVFSDAARCVITGHLISQWRFKTEFYNRPFLCMHTDRETALRAYFYAVAICHQTYHLHSPSRNLWGWDYIEDTFSRLVNQHHWIFAAGSLETSSLAGISSELAVLFSDTGKASDTTLDRLDERAQFLIEIDSIIKNHFDNSLIYFLKTTESKLFNSGYGFYELLENIRAFSDPFRKKSSFLIKLLEDARLVRISDRESFIPIMDYHMQRVMLRTGCVLVSDPHLSHALKQKQKLASDEEVRAACIEAMRLIATHSGIDLLRLNDVFWSLGRSCCNNTMLCETGYCEKTPCTFYQIIDSGNHNTCALREVCAGAFDESFRKYYQPVVDTHYY